MANLLLPTSNGDPLILEDFGASLMRKSGAVREDGTLDLAVLTTGEARYAGALSMLPGLQSKLDVAREAQEALEQAVVDKEAALERIRLSPAMLFVDHDPMSATEKLFALPDSTAAMRTLIELMEGHQEAIDGLRMAVTDYVRNRVGVTDDRATEYLEFLARHDKALATLFDESKMQTLRNIAASPERTTRGRGQAT